MDLNPWLLCLSLLFSAANGDRDINLNMVPDECYTRPDGVCISRAGCHKVNGKPYSPCFYNKLVCCDLNIYCTKKMGTDVTYMINLDYPHPLNKMGEYILLVGMVSEDIRQIRFDFIDFNLAPVNKITGECEIDMMTITNGESKSLKLCGPYSNRHIYYDIPFGQQYITINMTLNEGDYNRTWNIKVTQLIEPEQQAPAGCLQYYEDISEIVYMTNTKLNGRQLNHQKNLICIRHAPKMCSIDYEMCRNDIEKLKLPGFFESPDHKSPVLRSIPFGPNGWEEMNDTNTGLCLTYKQQKC